MEQRSFLLLRQAVKILAAFLLVSGLKIGLGSEAVEHLLRKQLVCPQSSVALCMFDANALRMQKIGLANGLANTYLVDKDYYAVIQVYSGLESGGGMQAFEHWQYAQALWFVGEREKAVEQFQAAQAVRGLTYQNLIDLSAWQVRAGDLDGGERTVSSIRRINPAAGSCQAIYISMFLLTEPAAPDIFNRADPQSVCRRNIQKWENYLTSAAKSDDPAYRWLLLGLGFARDGAWRMAAAAMEKSVLSNPGYTEAWAYLAEARWQLGEDGWPVLQRAYELDPASPVARSLMALYFRRHQQPETALEIYRKLSEEFPAQAVWLAEMGNIFGELGKFMDGLTYLNKAVQIEPKNPQNWAALAAFSFNYQIDVETTGLPAAEKYLELSPEDPSATDMVGLGKLLLEDFTGAEEYFLAAISEDAQFTQAYLHLGQAYLGQGRYQEAQQALKTALEQGGPSSETARRLLLYYFPDSH